MQAGTPSIQKARNTRKSFRIDTLESILSYALWKNCDRLHTAGCDCSEVSDVIVNDERHEREEEEESRLLESEFHTMRDLSTEHCFIAEKH